MSGTAEELEWALGKIERLEDRIEVLEDQVEILNQERTQVGSPSLEGE